MDVSLSIAGGRESARSFWRAPSISRGLASAAIALTIVAAVASPVLARPDRLYQVRPGDTLSSIAREFGLSVGELAATNDLANADRINSGQIIALHPSGPTTPAPDTSPIAPIKAPYFNQFDGSVWAASNCGPANLAMALGALGIRADPIGLRMLANRQMGNHNPASGTTWEALAYAAQREGASVQGLYQGRSYRHWTIDDVQNELRQGHPVLLLVRYRYLPDHLTSGYWGDHYITALGVDRSGNLIYHDSAAPAGAYRTISEAQLMQAWGHTSVGLVRTAMAIVR